MITFLRMSPWRTNAAGTDIKIILNRFHVFLSKALSRFKSFGNSLKYQSSKTEISDAPPHPLIVMQHMYAPGGS